jgi:ribonucleotide reductase class II
MTASEFPVHAPSALPLFFRSYSRRKDDGSRESWKEVIDRNLGGLARLGDLTEEQLLLLRRHQENLTALPSGRWLWVGGTPWSDDPRNFYGSYNCSSRAIHELSDFATLMNLAMQGTGTGAVLTIENLQKLPTIVNGITITHRGEIGATPPERRAEATMTTMTNRGHMEIKVGDSRKGWVDSYQRLLEAACDPLLADGRLHVTIDLSWVRPAGERLKGFGGTANPAVLKEMYGRVANILNKAVGRKLNSLEACLIIDEAARCVVAGNIRRSAGMRQFDPYDEDAAGAKTNLWVQDEDSNWTIDHERDALRMANHTRVFTFAPSFDEVLESVKSQYESGEGAIQYAPEALARANCDILSTEWLRKQFLDAIEEGGLAAGKEVLSLALCGIKDPGMASVDDQRDLDHRMKRYGLNPCGEIIGNDFMCNLAEVHLNQLDPDDHDEVDSAFRAAALTVAVLLHHTFRDDRFRYSRSIDPIVGVSFTGLFDYFARAFGSEWLDWWQEGRPPSTEGLRFTCEEEKHLARFRQIVESEVADYCTKNGLRIPNRSTTVQPAGCLTPEALRVCDNGLYLIDELAGASNELKRWAPFTGSAKVRNMPIAGIVENHHRYEGESLGPLTEITFYSGRKLRVTPDHRFKEVLPGPGGGTGWIRADELSAETELQFSPGSYTNPHASVPLEPLPHYSRPELSHVSEDLAYVMGFLAAARGTDSMGTFITGARADSYFHRLVEVANAAFGPNFAKPHRLKCRTRVTIDVAAAEDWLDRNGLRSRFLSDHFTPIPLPFRLACREDLLAFFCGIIDGARLTIGTSEMLYVDVDEWHPDTVAHVQEVGEAIGLVFISKIVNRRRSLRLAKGHSTSYAINYLNHRSSLSLAPLQSMRCHDRTSPFQIVDIGPCYAPITSDITLDTDSDNEAWYFNGALISHNSKSLLTNASPGWHPPKAVYYIRRITFAREDPIALACIDYGYNVVPSQSDKDENGRLLDDPWDPRCTEWLVEIPTAVPWHDLPHADEVDPSKFSALAQFDFYMRVQHHYSGHNTSATIELSKEEIRPLARAIHAAITTNQGYISAALLARMDDKHTYPRMPFESIDRATYEEMCAEVLKRRVQDDFYQALTDRDAGSRAPEQPQGPAGCDSDKCLMPLASPAG